MIDYVFKNTNINSILDLDIKEASINGAKLGIVTLAVFKTLQKTVQLTKGVSYKVAAQFGDTNEKIARNHESQKNFRSFKRDLPKTLMIILGGIWAFNSLKPQHDLNKPNQPRKDKPNQPQFGGKVGSQLDYYNNNYGQSLPSEKPGKSSLSCNDYLSFAYSSDQYVKQLSEAGRESHLIGWTKCDLDHKIKSMSSNENSNKLNNIHYFMPTRGIVFDNVQGNEYQFCKVDEVNAYVSRPFLSEAKYFLDNKKILGLDVSHTDLKGMFEDRFYLHKSETPQFKTFSDLLSKFPSLKNCKLVSF